MIAIEPPTAPQSSLLRSADHSSPGTGFVRERHAIPYASAKDTQNGSLRSRQIRHPTVKSAHARSIFASIIPADFSRSSNPHRSRVRR